MNPTERIEGPGTGVSPENRRFAPHSEGFRGTPPTRALQDHQVTLGGMVTQV